MLAARAVKKMKRYWKAKKNERAQQVLHVMEHWRGDKWYHTATGTDVYMDSDCSPSLPSLSPESHPADGT